MAFLRNTDSATGADIVGQEATPTLALSNASTGPGLKVDRLVSTSGATITSTATAAPAVTLGRTMVGSPSVGLAVLSVSGASVPVFDLQSSSFVSAVSIVFAASANWAGMGGIRVKLSDGITYAWIPILPGAVFTAATAS